RAVAARRGHLAQPELQPRGGPAGPAARRLERRQRRRHQPAGPDLRPALRQPHRAGPQSAAVPALRGVQRPLPLVPGPERLPGRLPPGVRPVREARGAEHRAELRAARDEGSRAAVLQRARPEPVGRLTLMLDTDVSPRAFVDTARAIEAEIGKVIVGQSQVIRGVLICLLSGGHTLLEGVPGLGKTMLVRTLGRALDLTFARIQFTPDLMPADITGTNVIYEDDAGNRSFRFQQGPLFANIVLADEINRATPKTQSALLEAMQEHRVTAGRGVHPLPEPFFVLATQNPIEMEGTYPLPEAQLDRFLFKLYVPFPSA